MTYIRCTQKLLKLLGIKPDEVSGTEEGGPLGDWYANLLWIERKKCILFMHDRTLFSFLVPGVKKEDLKDLNAFFREQLRKGLAAVEIDGSVTAGLLLRLGPVSIVKTASRKVLGAMNDHAVHYSVYFSIEEGGIGGADIPEVIRKVNNVPMKGNGYATGFEKLKELLSISVVSGGTPVAPEGRKVRYQGMAHRRWNKIPPEIRQQILGSVWCSHCRKGVVMELTEGRMEERTLVLEGLCRTCGQPVVRVVEPE